MALSDAEHAYVLNALERYEATGGLLIKACEIAVPWLQDNEVMPFMKDRQIADALYLIVASEGRSFDLPEQEEQVV